MRFLRSDMHAMEREMARLAGGNPFQPDKSFLTEGVGLALDRARRMMFLATREGGRLHAAIIPFNALAGYTQGERRDSGFYDYYVDISVRDAAHPSWRLVCGERPELVTAIREVLKETMTA